MGTFIVGIMSICEPNLNSTKGQILVPIVLNTILLLGCITNFDYLELDNKMEKTENLKVKYLSHLANEVH